MKGNQYLSTLHQEHPHHQFTVLLLHQGHQLCQPRQSLYRLNLLENIVLEDKTITLLDRGLLHDRGLLRRNGKWNVSQDVGEDSHPWSINQVAKNTHHLHQQHRVAINGGLAAFRQGAGMRKRREPSERANASSMRIDSLEPLGLSRKPMIGLFD